MKESLQEYLVCPDCRVRLDLSVSSRAGAEIDEGILHCGECRGTNPIVRGVPRFVSSDSYVRNFSYQWNLHRTTQVDSLSGHKESRNAFAVKTGLNEGDLRGKLVLDVGCGTGRYVEIAADWGGEVIGMDLSYAVDAAYLNMGRRERVHIVQADVFRLPFRIESFDVIYSIGVLHHTHNTREAFLQLPPLLRPTGTVSVWVYEWAGEFSEFLDYVRRWSVHVPPRLLYHLCWVIVPLQHAAMRVPLLNRLGRRVPTSNQGRGLRWDVLDTFDLYAPRFQWKHREQEVLEWFRQAALTDLRLLSFPVSVKGRRPTKLTV